jgi:glycosyltransferase involved in cell wall biosynthesis
MKLSIVTPAYNMEKYIARTIESVLSQRGDFDLEYIIVNDGSTDNTGKIVLEYQEKILQGKIPKNTKTIDLRYEYQPNQGMYSAINKGFSKATGDIFAWIGGDDIYSPNTAFAEMTKWFSSHPESLWAKGMCGLMDKDANKIRDGKHRPYYQDWLREGIYGRETYFVEQESVFWRKELWEKVAPLPTKYKAASDYWLWIEFAKHAPLDSLPIQVAYFRVRPGQISSNKKRYKDEQRQIFPQRSILASKVRLYSIFFNRFPPLRTILRKIHPILFSGKVSGL